MYRKSVGIVITNDDNKVMIFKRIYSFTEYIKNPWQFSQGGVDKGEDVEVAMRRELKEEANITSIEILKKMDKSIKYNLPEDVKKNLKWDYEGQEQTWFLVKFTGDEKDIRFDTSDFVEFCEYKWVDPKESIDLVVDFRKSCYSKVIKEFFNV